MTEPRTERHLEKSATSARQGVTGHNVRYVLILSLAGIVIIFGALWLFFTH
jgi:hypothetical protein